MEEIQKIKELIANHNPSTNGEEDEVYTLGEISDLVEKAKAKGIKIEMESVGSFDSPGYDMTAYAIAYVDDNGEIQIIGFEDECF